MHDLTLFLVGVAVIGLSPLALGAAYLLRRGRTDEGGPGRTGVRGVAALLLVLAAVSFAGAWWLRGAAAPGSATAHVDAGGPGLAGAATTALPASLAGLRRTAVVTGAEAVRSVEALHGRRLPVVTAEIAEYAGGRATVWMSRSDRPRAARALVERMARGIAGGGSPFSAPSAVAGERGVWATEGMGQVHYFFARGPAVWWLSADEAVAERALAELLEVAG